ncbi:MAG: hypothetical protein K2Q03_10980 [Sphingobacteriaceae bacterium]|nr:hypothetical protein [Sphingobacteriaceae bacterium]
MVLHISDYKYQDLNQIKTTGLLDKLMLAKYRHLKLINSPDKYLSIKTNLKSVVNLSRTSIIRLFFSYDITKQVIASLINNSDIEYKKNTILFIKGLVIQNNSYIGGKILNNDADINLIEKILAYDYSIFDRCIANRSKYLSEHFKQEFVMNFQNRISEKVQPIIDKQKVAQTIKQEVNKS